MKTLEDYGVDEVKFDLCQMEQIRLGLESKVDVSIYADPKFNPAQMKQIRLGLENDVDVSVYANPEFDAAQMKPIRLKLEKEAANPTGNKPASTSSMSLF